MRITLILLVLTVGVSLAQAPGFDPFWYVYAGGSRIDCGYYGSPCVADWDVDGDKDLVLGIFTGGNIYFYANDNTNDSPVLASQVTLQADGVNITLPSG